MKTSITTGYTFAPGAKTIDFAGVSGFDIKRLLGVINATAGKLIYAPGLSGLGYTALAGSALTLAFDTTGMGPTDKLLVFYDDAASVPTRRPPLSYSTAFAGALTAGWQKVTTTTLATKSMRIAVPASAGAFDVEWTAVTAGAAAPTDTFGEAVLGGEDFASGLPLGDIYLRSATQQVAIVKLGA